MPLHLRRSLGSLAVIAVLAASLSGCLRTTQYVDRREASLGVVRSFSDVPGTAPRMEPPGKGGAIPDEPMNVPTGPEPPSDVLWTPTAGLPMGEAETAP